MSLDRVYLALDQMEEKEIKDLILSSEGKVKNVKIGLEAYLSFGPQLIIDLKNMFNVNIFLDLKLHDIPITVSKAIHSLKGLPISFLTIHLTGGSEMIKEAIKARDISIPNTKILGVSILTSLDSNNFLEMYDIELTDKIFRNLFTMAAKTGIDGIVCSPNEVKHLKEIDPNIITMTPGVRFANEINSSTNIGDQKRVASIEWALKNQCDYIVMGRSLTKIKNQIEFLEKLTFIDSL